jgi:regulator of protease activity HflC (stomatin/prohibitin superfamily)
MTSTLLLLLVLLALLMVLALAALRLAAQHRVTVWPWEAGLLYVNGRFAAALGPGRYWHGIGGREVHRIPTARQIHAIPAQEVLTADGFPVKLGVVAEYRIADARRAQEETGGRWMDALHTATQLAIRAPVLARGLDAVLADRGALEAEFLPSVQAALAGIGIEVERVALRDLILPAEVRRLVTEVERAKREGQAALERARGEQAALRSLANAARLMKGNPELHALRVLQALAAAPGKVPPTLVLGAGALLPMAGAASAAAADPAPEE